MSFFVKTDYSSDLVDETGRNGGGLGLRPMDRAREAGFTQLAWRLQAVAKERAEEEKERRDAVIYGRRPQSKQSKQQQQQQQQKQGGGGGASSGTGAATTSAANIFMDMPEDTRKTIPID